MLCKRIIIGGGSTPSGPTSDTNGWIRDPEWLAMPDIEATDNKAAILFAAPYPGGTSVALTCDTTDASQYTVDWGDGSVEDVNSGTQAQHIYEFDALPSATTHSVYGYRQALCVVTPKTAGKTFSKVLLNKYHSSQVYAISHRLDVVISAPVANDIRNSAYTYRCPLQERFLLLSCAVPQADSRYMFWDCTRIKSITLPSGFRSDYISGMFYQNGSLYSLPSFDTASNTSLESIARYSIGVAEVPAYDLDAATNLGTMVDGALLLRRFRCVNIGASLDLSFKQMDRESILEVFGNLKTVSGTKNLTLDYNPGVLELTPADWNIAAAKGWTIYPAGAAPAITDDGALNVTITSSGGHLVYPVYYTIGVGGDPTVSGTLYTGPFAVSALDLVTAVEYRTGYGPTNRPHPYAIIS